MAQLIAERIRVIDTDTHVVEPNDLWTSRMPKKWHDLVPHVVKFEGTPPPGSIVERGDDVWVMGEDGIKLTDATLSSSMPAGIISSAGWKTVPPAHPPTIYEGSKAGYDPHARLKLMDEYGIYAMLLYPNVAGFGSQKFLTLKEPELMLECVRAYNDFLTEWCSADPKRLIALTATPFWDIDATVAEVKRCAKNGHKGINFSCAPNSLDPSLPFLADPHWNPLWQVAAEMDMPINFHIGSGSWGNSTIPNYAGNGRQANYAKMTTNLFLDNAIGIEEVIVSGICHRNPKVNFVSVESGVGWIPFLLESLDWQWVNSGVREEHPEYNLLPSDYFKRQVYGAFWFEKNSLKAALDAMGANNWLFETDFPHPTSVAPGPNTTAQNPKIHIENNLAGIPEDVCRKILYENAARIYHLD